MITQKYVILLMRFCAPTILAAQAQSELGPELLYIACIHVHNTCIHLYSVHEMTDTGGVSSLKYRYV